MDLQLREAGELRDKKSKPPANESAGAEAAEPQPSTSDSSQGSTKIVIQKPSPQLKRQADAGQGTSRAAEGLCLLIFFPNKIRRE